MDNLNNNTIDTAEFRDLIASMKRYPHEEGCVLTLIAHIDALMAAARQEAYKKGFDFGHELGKVESAAAAREQALAALVEARAFILNQPVVATGSRMDGGCTLKSETPLRVIGNLDAAIEALKSQPATQPAPAAGLTDDEIFDAMKPGLLLADGGYVCDTARYHVIGAGKALLERASAQQPAQAVAKDEKQGGLVEQIKQQVMARLAHRGLLSDLSHNGVRIIGYELLSDVERVVAEFGIEPLCQQAAIKAMVERFLGWPIPKSFSPDCGISFDGRKDDQWNKNKPWPIGTNLLNADEARQMFEYVLQGAAPLATHEGKAGDGKDSERYRWLRDPNRGMANLSTVCNEGEQPPFFELKCGEELDTAIDAAMQAQQAGKAGA